MLCFYFRWLAANDEETMYLDIECPVMRYIVHNELRHRFPEVLTTDSLGNSNKVIFANHSYLFPVLLIFGISIFLLFEMVVCYSIHHN